MDKFNERLQKLAQIYGQSQTDMRIKLDFSKSTMSNYWNGNRSPKANIVDYIADAYNINPAWLLGYDVEMVNNKSENVNTGDLLAIVATDNKAVEYIRKLMSLSNDKRQLVYNIIDSYVS